MSPLKPNPYLAKLLVCADAVLAVELINTSASLSRFLLAGIERMALGANFNVDLRLCGACHECVAAVACYSCLIVIRMDSLFHVLSPRSILLIAAFSFSSARCPQ